MKIITKIIVASFIIWMTCAVYNLLVNYNHVYLQHKEAQEQLNKQKQEQERINKMSYKEMVAYIAPQFNQNPNELSLIIWNESQYEVKYHDGYRAKNITATQNQTFRDWLPQYEKDTGETLNIDSQFDQIKMMAWAFKTNRKVAWTTWVACQSPDKTYSFHSYQLDGDYTVVCRPLPKEYVII